MTAPVPGGPPSLSVAPLGPRDLRRLTGIGGEGPLSGEEGLEVGRRLAHSVPGPDVEPRPAPALPDDGEGLHVLLVRAGEELGPVGVVVEIVRVRPGCAVLRVGVDPHLADLSGAAVARGLLQALPARAGRGDAVLLESGPAGGDGPQVWTLLWGAVEYRPEPEAPSAGGALVPVAASNAIEAVREPDIAVAPLEPRSTRRQVRRRAGWFRRRWWIPVVTVLAGAAGGHLAAAHRAPVSTADATLVVQSGAGAQGPGDANDAAALAITDATYIPTDQSVLHVSSGLLGVPSSAVSGHISMTAQTGTAVMTLAYSADTPSEAVRGATTVARVVALGVGVPSGSVRIARLPTSATAGGSLGKAILPIGALLGLMIGLIIVLAVERADPRLDDDRSVSEAAGCPTCAVAGAAGPSELAPVIALHPPSGERVTLVPVSEAEAAEAEAMATRLRDLWPTDRAVPRIVVGTEEGAGAVDLASTGSSTVLVVGVGSRRRALCHAADRLRLLGCAPMCAIFVARPRRRRSESRAR